VHAPHSRVAQVLSASVFIVARNGRNRASNTRVANGGRAGVGCWACKARVYTTYGGIARVLSASVVIRAGDGNVDANSAIKTIGSAYVIVVTIFLGQD